MIEAISGQSMGITCGAHLTIKGGDVDIGIEEGSVWADESQGTTVR